VPRLLPILALPLLLDIVAIASAKILGTGTGGRQNIRLLRNSSQPIDAATVHDGQQIDGP
jgi:hypothetical protein